MIYNDITQLIGRTPVIRLSHIATNGAEVFVKAERFNPLGSAKDRAALFMIRGAEEKGLLSAGGTIVEPTSGNTGIALAAMAAVRGYRCVLVMPESMSLERRKLMGILGAELVLTPAGEGMKGAVAKARELVASTPGAWMPDQFSNPDNARAHEMTTAQEVLDDFASTLTHVVASVGSAGTIMGLSRRLRVESPATRIVAVEPAASPMLSEGRAGRHRIQGIGAGFVPGLYDPALVDQVVTVTEDEAIDMTRQLARKEALFVGISSGAALSGALKLAGEGARILVMLPDTGERYLSQEWW